MARMVRVPRKDQDIYDRLSHLFRTGAIYSFSWDGNAWEVWHSAADWDATERNGRVRDLEAAAAGHGPMTFSVAEIRDRYGIGNVKPAPRLSKAQLVAKIRALNPSPDVLEVLAAA